MFNREKMGTFFKLKKIFLNKTAYCYLPLFWSYWPKQLDKKKKEI